MDSGLEMGMQNLRFVINNGISSVHTLHNSIRYYSSEVETADIIRSVSLILMLTALFFNATF